MQEGTIFCIFAFMFPGRSFFIVILAFFPLTAYADGGVPDGQKHCIRIGWGDMMYESASYYPSAKHVFGNPSALPDNYRVREAYGHHFIGHMFAEYQYRMTDILSFGAQLDFSSISWQNGIFDRFHELVFQEQDTRYYNFVIMPTARATYFQIGPASLYSGIGAGMLLSVSDAVEASFALNINLIGVQIGFGHWYGALELGMLSAFAGLNKIYMLGSRIVSVSINYAW